MATKIEEFRGESHQSFSKRMMEIQAMGWKEKDRELIEKTRYLNGIILGIYVSGSVLFEKKEKL